MKWLVPTICLALAGCAANPAPQAPTLASASTAARPDPTKAVQHLKAHVQYPASRAAILAACADTPEFTADEKKWLSDQLPDRTYASADEVATALHLSPAVARPDATKAVQHLKAHVQYPASRAAILAACANTPEFTADEKKWLSDHLPDRTYTSADEVATALHL